MPRSPRARQTDPDSESGFATPPRPPAPRDEVSPAETFDTALTSPMRTFDESETGSPAKVRSSARFAPPPQTVEISHKVKSAGSAPRSAGLIFGLSKPFIGIGLVLLVVGAAAGLGWFKIPGLTTQIKALEEQVANLNIEINRLSSEVDRLEEENDRFESLNDRLNMTAFEFEELANELNITVQELEDVADRLNITSQELVFNVYELAMENLEYQRLNTQLNGTVASLSVEVQTFEDALRELILENSILSNLTEALQALTDNLNDVTVEQNETLIELRNVLADFVAENDRLESLNDDLVSVVSFLNETSLGIDRTLQGVTDFLATQISSSKVLVLASIESKLDASRDNWDCDYRDIFREEPFGTDFNVPITDMDAVLSYVDNKVLSELCLDRTDFVNQLAMAYPPAAGTLTSFRLMRSVLRYTDAAIDYYFPEDGEVGLAYEDWAAASFECQNLANTFAWDGASGTLAD
jgi:predicted  nucleic acid-binding Zn-ribbon protein